MKQILHKIIFVLRHRYFGSINTWCRKFLLRLAGMKVGKNTIFGKLYITWPNQVFMGDNCILEHSIYFKYDGIWKKGYAIYIDDNVFIGSCCEFNISKSVYIGKHSLIASGCRFIDHDHGIKLGKLMGPQPSVESAIKVGNDVWIGCNVTVLKGVEIEDGAVVAAGAVVTKSIAKNEIWAGVPARKIGERK